MRMRLMLAVIALVACAPAAYVEPAGGETATLRIENETAAIFGYELEADTYSDAGACAGRLRIADARALPRGVPRNLRVSADAEFTLTFRGSGGGASRADSCAVAGTFRPLAGERYAAIFRSTQQKCELVFAVLQSGSSARRYVREPSYRERFEPACLGASAPSSIPAPAAVPQPPPVSIVPPKPPSPPR